MFAIAITAAALACGDEGSETNPEVACQPLSLPVACENDTLGYADVAPIFETHCLACHAGDNLLPRLTSYADAAALFESIPSEIATCSMPPEDSMPSMSEDERLLVLDWFRCGFPE